MFTPVVWAYPLSSQTVQNLERRNMPKRRGQERNRLNICLFSVKSVSRIISIITLIHTFIQFIMLITPVHVQVW